MKNTTIIRIFLISLLLITFTACSDKGTNSNAIDSIQSLVGTSWKLVGFVDAETNVMKEAENRLNCEKCYKINFVSNNEFTGFTAINSIQGDYNVNFTNKKITIITKFGTDAGEFKDSKVFSDIIEKLIEQDFSVSKDSLKLYYENGSKYLLFEKKQ